LDEVRALVSQLLQLRGFDPIANQFFTWPIDTATYTDWLEAGLNSLTLREDAFVPYIDLLNTTLNPEGENTRYLAPDETMDLLRDAIATGETLINLRVRYRPTTYEVVRGDTAFAIARKTGIPLFLIEQANSGRDLNILSVGDVLNIPSPDAVIPEAPVPDKRIVVDLDAQYLMAFENGQVVFEWPISSGVRDAPTSPGVYQILSHREQAYGSSSTLCDAAGVVCGQWEMNWFMGIYEVRPGLVNGFHGSVLLPNGNMLGDGVIGQPITFGCVMSPDEQARALYDWADIGTIVEIVSDEFAPVSDLGRFTVTQTGTNI
ncbi:MAG: L,D-transpeptidase family protein, partial [Chloroflexota bacterium]